MKPHVACVFSAVAIVATLSTTAIAAPEPTRVRGTVATVAPDTLTIHGANADTTVALAAGTKYLKVVHSSLATIAPGSYIGTATKSVGGKLIALEVVIFPPAMKGAGEGHYAWDELPDTTQSGAAHNTMSSMTNGSVAAVAPTGGHAVVKSSMTNGSVATATAKGGAKLLTVTYKGGEQKILVPPTAPIVTFEPGALTDVTTGKAVFIVGAADAGKVAAQMVAVGENGVTPPM